MADETKERGSRKTRIGTVVSSKMDKTAVVAVERKVAHPFYGKQLKRTKTYYAQDDENAAREGDVVKIEETRPVSKTKRWRILEIVERAK
jgi:small subunit ribosomal protein S17